VKKIWLAGALLASLLSGRAGAADLQVRLPFKAPLARPWSWSGYYIGINGGYGWNGLTGETSCVAGCLLVPAANLNPQGGLFGAQAGYNIQMGRVVYGLEVDIQGAGIKDSAFFANGVIAGVNTGDFTASQNLDWFGTTRLRAGWTAWDNMLLYVTGGLIYGRESISATTVIPGIGTNTASDAAVRVGGVFGAGLERAFGGNLSAKVEALYYDMGSETITSSGVGFTQSGTFNFRGAIFRGGLNWRLDGQSPGAPASAAGMMVKARPRPIVDDWTGYYVGANVGANWGHSDVTPDSSVPFPVFTNLAGNLITPAQVATWPAASGAATSVVGGGQAGYNWRDGQFVWGVEADLDGTGLRETSSSTMTRTTISGTQTVTANFSANVDLIASFRGRLGYVWDHSMLYATAGLAAAETELNTTYAIIQPAPPPTPGSASSRRFIPGWTAGVGGEWVIDNARSVALEYRHTDLATGGYNLGFTDVSLAPFIGPTPGTVHFTTDEVTARLNWHWH
jgi:outer membrane immunogenic protein